MQPPSFHGDDHSPTLGEVAYSAAQIADRVADVAAELNEWYATSTPVLVSILKGATYFVSDLTRHLTMPHEIDFLAVSAYGEATAHNSAHVMKDFQTAVTGRDVLIVEDVVDTGLTLRFLHSYVTRQQPASIEVCTLLDRPHRRLTAEPIRFRGFTVPDTFYVGYGFDYRQRYRNLPDLHELHIDEPQRSSLLTN